MNERIKELWDEAWDDNTPLSIIRNKFAKLIVRECAELCMKKIDTGLLMAPQSPEMAKQILQHFGVEISEPVKERISEPLANQEPVAYWNGKDMFKRADEVKYVVNWTDYYYLPLYSEPRPCQTCESLAYTVMMDQTSHDMKREWAGLTEDEIEDIFFDRGQYTKVDLKAFARAIEAALKEKNNG